MNIEYLLFNTVVFFSPFCAKVLFPRITRFPEARGLFFSIAIVGIFFVLIDNAVTGYFWDFNSQYILGITLANLPFEEVLFFITVPFSCLVLWENIKNHFKKRFLSKNDVKFFILALVLLGSIFFIAGKLYSVLSILLVLLAIAIGILTNFKWGYRKNWLIFLGLICFMTLIFNYYLTARPVVLYNDIFNSNIMILTIPIEDFLFGLGMISMNVFLYEYFIKKTSIKLS